MALKVIWEQQVELTSTIDNVCDAATQCAKSIANGESLQFTVIDDSGKVYSVDLNEQKEDIVLEVAQNDLSLYQQIEQAIIWWNNDGTRTAGSLTRELFAVLKNVKNQ